MSDTIVGRTWALSQCPSCKPGVIQWFVLILTRKARVPDYMIQCSGPRSAYLTYSFYCLVLSRLRSNNMCRNSFVVRQWMSQNIRLSHLCKTSSRIRTKQGEYDFQLITQRTIAHACKCVLVVGRVAAESTKWSKSETQTIEGSCHASFDQALNLAIYWRRENAV